MPGPVSLLVATPGLTDPNFARTVVLLLERSADGALGLVLNRPSPTVLGEALPAWESVASPPAVVYLGGPVATTAAVCLARRGPGTAPPGWQALVGPLGVLDLDVAVAEAAAAVADLRVFAGYAGWGPGQLEGEVAAGAWLELAASESDPFTGAPERLWADVLRRQGGELAMLATFPPDPHLN